MRKTFNRRGILLLAGAFFMANLCGCSGNISYKNYSSKDPLIGLSMDYIADWRYDEQRGAHDRYAQVMFYKLGEKGKKPSWAVMAVMVEEASKAAFSPQTASGMAKDLLDKRSKMQDMQVLSQKDTALSGGKGRDITLSYNKINRFPGAGAKLIPVRERIVILERGTKLYALRYENSAEDFDSLNPAFERSLKTLKIK
jgi:hypothetical protein